MFVRAALTLKRRATAVRKHRKDKPGTQLKAKGLQNVASVVGGAAVFSSLAHLPEPDQSFASKISLAIG